MQKKAHELAMQATIEYTQIREKRKNHSEFNPLNHIATFSFINKQCP
jgi:hypothetical protein